MNIAIAQIDVSCGEFESNLRKIKRYSTNAADLGADVVVFPELVDLGYDLRCYVKSSQTCFISHKNELEKLCTNLGIIIVLGGARYENEGIYNSQFILLPDESLETAYTKNYLFIGESDTFKAGYGLNKVVFENHTAGFQICFDIRFPELLRNYKNTPEIIYVSAAWPLSRIKHWEQLLVSRAIENQCYIIASNRVGTDSLLTFGGTSMIVSPNGDVLKKGSSNHEEIIICKVDIESVKSLRKSFPVLEHRKT